MLEKRLTLKEAADAVKGGQFVHIHRYTNKYGEVSNVTVHAGASYENTHKQSLEKLAVIEADIGFQIEIERHFYQDAQGIEYLRNTKDGSRKPMTKKEVVKSDDQDLKEAIGKIRKSLLEPRKIESGFEKVSNSLYEHKNGQLYLRNVLVASKTIVEAGIYPFSCSDRVNVIADAIREDLPIGKYRTYIIDDKPVEARAKDGATVLLPRFEYVSMAGEVTSSSSSSEG
jgi:hypothetical protein